MEAYGRLAKCSSALKLAGGEGCHNFQQAKNMIDYAGLGYVQIDAGRIGGITTAKQVADYARKRGVRFVNHTFTTHLALSASLQPYAGVAGDDLCEYPFEPSALARDFTAGKIAPDANGQVGVTEDPGLGMEPDWAALKKYVRTVKISVAGRIVFRSSPPPL